MIPRSAASSTASDDGAPTATSSGQPATGGLLDELEREAAADAEERARERQQPVEERAADDLVERVVAADVLATQSSSPVGGEEPGGVQPAGRLECRLRVAEPVGELDDQRGRHAQVALDPRRLDGDGLERPLPQTPHDDEV